MDILCLLFNKIDLFCYNFELMCVLHYFKFYNTFERSYSLCLVTNIFFLTENVVCNLKPLNVHLYT